MDGNLLDGRVESGGEFVDPTDEQGEQVLRQSKEADKAEEAKEVREKRVCISSQESIDSQFDYGSL